MAGDHPVPPLPSRSMPTSWNTRSISSVILLRSENGLARKNSYGASPNGYSPRRCRKPILGELRAISLRWEDCTCSPGFTERDLGSVCVAISKLLSLRFFAMEWNAWATLRGQSLEPSHRDHG